ncbi:winged helix-turn-helix domain-containing protein [Nonomuraea thailandensis]
MEFRLLGPVEVWDGTQRVPLGGPKPRALLASLLLSPGRVVSVDRLVDLIWSDRVPGTARELVQTYVSALRRRLRTEVIVTRPPVTCCTWTASGWTSRCSSDWPRTAGWPRSRAGMRTPSRRCAPPRRCGAAPR